MDNMLVSVAPHIHSSATTRRIMLDVIIALVPSFVCAVVVFGPRAALVTGVCVAVCVLCEWAYEKLLKRPVTIGDLSACITGILLAFNLPVAIPLWQAAFGCVVAIILVKQLFGGIGKNFANPAITARVFMFVAFPVTMTTWMQLPDAVSGATPLMLLSRGEFESLPTIWDMVIGTRGGCLGETGSIALLIGGLYLIIRRVITWHTPIMFMATTVLLTMITGGPSLAVYQLFGGGLLIGAIFMATDYATSPQTNFGRIIFGIGCGVITALIRMYGSYPEGVSYSILIMNMLVPYINKLTMSKALGGK